MDSPNYRISIQGLSSTISAIERFAPDLKKQLDKEVKGVLSKVVTQAREHIPFEIHPSGWARENKNAGLIGPLQAGQGRGSFVRFDAAKAKAGIKSTSPSSGMSSRRLVCTACCATGVVISCSMLNFSSNLVLGGKSEPVATQLVS